MDPYIGEIRLFAGNYEPAGWKFCHGQELQVKQNQALFSVIGNAFGGDGENTFRLPDLRALVPVHCGWAPGLTPRKFAGVGGSVTVPLQESQIPLHNHIPQYQTTSNSNSAEGTIWGVAPGGKNPKPVYTPVPNEPMNSNAIQPAGLGMPHNNMQPYLTLNFIIALEGVYPVKDF